MQESFDFAKVVGVVAVMRDKDVHSLLDLLEPMLDEIVVTRNSSPRSMSPDELAAMAVAPVRRGQGAGSSSASTRPSTWASASPTLRASSAARAC